jgi:predicted helicase
MLENILELAITTDEETQENTSLKGQYETFKRILIHDLTPKGFADIYAQTLAYGMFAARLHDTSLDDFSRQEAAELIPKSNPFLRKLFLSVAGPDIDDRIRTTVDNLADVFRATDVDALLHNFGKSTQTSDPIIHFYETFLSEYDPKLRKSRGVWYTPEPVVNFIVRAVDDILKTEFGLSQGLADTSKTKIKVPDQGGKKPLEKEVHKVQILDPATGTGTFLAAVVKHIYNHKFKSIQGAWSGYVDEHLIPRLNGFELLMASYSMAHLKLDMLLTETGYKATKDQRFNIYLTNSLEEYHPDTGTLFSGWLSSEANEANHIKRDTPVMCVIGNPPYSVSSTNKSEWIEKLIIDYKKELNEKSYNSLSDDYVKFIRYGQHFVDKNGNGILAYISNNSFIDGIVFRQMRKNLLESFDKIYILDLHGNSKKKEVCPDGSTDQNVFDIMQGVSINIFVKTGKTKKLADSYHFDLFGKRNDKYTFLKDNSIKSIKWDKLKNVSPNFYFIKKDFEGSDIYNEGFSVDELFIKNNVGVVTARDAFTLNFTKEDSKKSIEKFLSLEEEEARSLFDLGKDARDWKVSFAKKDLEANYPHKGLLLKSSHRPFDERWTFYTGNSKGYHSYPRNDIMHHLLGGENLALIAPKQAIRGFNHIFTSKNICDKNYIESAGQFGAGNVFPLYLYPELNNPQSITEGTERTPNLKSEIIADIANALVLNFTKEKENTENTFAPIDILDYIYAILHSPSYRKKYKEFLKIDFPRIPYPKDKKTFWKLVKLGSEIRQIHLLESPKVDKHITSYPIDGDHEVVKLTYIGGKVWINDTQYFDGVPAVAWNFYIGGYQPAQKWLKDRKGRKLNFDDINHYQKIIVALTETDRIMKEIDKIEIE